MSSPKPLLLERRALPKVWGGRFLVDQFGVEGVAPDEMVGETWELFDRPDGSSSIRGSSRTLRELMRDDPRGLLGEGVEPAMDGRFPLLVKLIDARGRLSIQVHPGGDQALSYGDGPKDEAWIVLAAGDDARIVRGFREGVTRAQVEAAARDGAALEGLVHEFRPRVGDVIHVPPGVAHAIGPDVVVFEVQQNSDLTFRLWDWGRPRPLHVEAALEALTVGDDGPPTIASERIDAQSEWLLRESAFRVRRFRLESQVTLSTEGAFKVLTVVDGMAALGWRNNDEHPPLPIRRGDTVLVPACVEGVFLSPIGGFEFLWTEPGEAR